jgi:hypothetical protein
MSTPITPVQNTSVIRTAEFVKLVITFTNNINRITRTLYFSNSYKSETISGDTYTQLGVLLGIGSTQRDINASGYDTNIGLTGLDNSYLYFVAGGPASSPVPVTGQPDIPIGYYPIIKGSIISITKGFYNSNYTLTNTFLRYTGLVTSYVIKEDRDEDSKTDFYTINLQCSAYRRLLENKTSGRKTNQKTWEYWSNKMYPLLPLDTSMNRVAGLQDVKFDFGKPVVSGNPSQPSTQNPEIAVDNSGGFYQ